MTAADYLKKPFARRVTPDESGGYVATIQEFPGCVAEGETPAEAFANLESAAESWIEAALSTGQSIPEPIDFQGYNGKFALRMPRGLHRQAAETAAAQGTSLNQFLVAAIAHFIGAGQASRNAQVVLIEYKQPNPSNVIGDLGSTLAAEILAHPWARNQVFGGHIFTQLGFKPISFSEPVELVR